MGLSQKKSPCDNMSISVRNSIYSKTKDVFEYYHYFPSHFHLIFESYKQKSRPDYSGRGY